MKLPPEEIAELRKFRGEGMVSAVGEYTPPELWDALDEIERLRGLLAERIPVGWMYAGDVKKGYDKIHRFYGEEGKPLIARVPSGGVPVYASPSEELGK